MSSGSYSGIIGPAIGAFATARQNSIFRKKEKKQRSLDYQREDTQIQRRVADAQAAGVHPLFALGGSMGNSSPFAIGQEADIGPAIERTVTAAEREYTGRNDEDRQLRESALEESKARVRMYDAAAQRDLVDAQAKASDNARAIQKQNVVQDQGKPVSIYDKSSSNLQEFAADIKAWQKATGREDRTYDIVEGPGGYSLHDRSRGKAQEHEDVYGEISDYTVGPLMKLRDHLDTAAYNTWRIEQRAQRRDARDYEPSTHLRDY